MLFRIGIFQSTLVIIWIKAREPSLIGTKISWSSLLRKLSLKTTKALLDRTTMRERSRSYYSREGQPRIMQIQKHFLSSIGWLYAMRNRMIVSFTVVIRTLDCTLDKYLRTFKFIFRRRKSCLIKQRNRNWRTMTRWFKFLFFQDFHPIL